MEKKQSRFLFGHPINASFTNLPRDSIRFSGISIKIYSWNSVITFFLYTNNEFIQLKIARRCPIKSKAEKTVRHYDKLSSRYDEKYPVYLKETHQKLLINLDLSPDDKILDVSAGTGILAEQIIRKHGPFRKFVLNDPSENMLERAKYRLRYEDNIEYKSYYTEELPFKENSFTSVLCLNAFHYYVDQEKALHNIHRVLKTGGTFYIQDWNRVGRMRLSDKFIKWFSPENINTRNLPEMKEMLNEYQFKIKEVKEWGFRWWKFFFVKCEK